MNGKYLVGCNKNAFHYSWCSAIASRHLCPHVEFRQRHHQIQHRNSIPPKQFTLMHSGCSQAEKSQQLAVLCFIIIPVDYELWTRTSDQTLVFNINALMLVPLPLLLPLPLHLQLIRLTFNSIRPVHYCTQRPTVWHFRWIIHGWRNAKLFHMPKFKTNKQNAQNLFSPFLFLFLFWFC